MAFIQSIEASLKDKRRQAKIKQQTYGKARLSSKSLSSPDLDLIRKVCVEMHQALAFGKPSLARYVELQRNWLRIGSSIKSETIDTARSVVSNDAKRSAHLIPAICKTWCQIAGVSFDRFPVVEMRYQSQVMTKLMWKQSCFVRYTGQMFSDQLTDLEGFDARWSENPTLTLLACVVPVVPRSLGPECFKTLKADWRERGGSDADFRWLANRSRAWLNQVLALTRENALEIVPILLIVCRLRLRLCHLRHPVVKACVGREMSARHGSGWREKLLFAALGRSLAAYSSPISRFNPFGFKTENQSDRYAQEFQNFQDWFENLERTEEIDRLLKSATLESLKRRSDEWHEQMRRDHRKARRQLQFKKGGVVQWSEHDIRFQWLESSAELLEETEEMKHCVAGYDVDCFDELYRVYRVTGRTVHGSAVRATVGYRRDSLESAWYFEQAQGPMENRLVDREVEIAARLLNRELNRGIDVPTENPPLEQRGDDREFALAA